MRRLSYGLVFVGIFAFYVFWMFMRPFPALGLDYDVVYLRMPRVSEPPGNRWPEVRWPTLVSPSTDLMLLKADGTENVLVPGGATGAVFDPSVSFDGQWVYYSLCPNVTSRVNNTLIYGCDIHKINVTTREVVQLTTQELKPNTGAANWCSDPMYGQGDCVRTGYGVFSAGPQQLPGGKVVFTSNRHAYWTNTGDTVTAPNLQLVVLDEATGDVNTIGHLNLGSALHPVVLTDGRIMFSSYEAQGRRNNHNWGLWAILPDGRQWQPLWSAFQPGLTMHWHGETSDRGLVGVLYYNLNNNGTGMLLKFDGGTPMDGRPVFGSPDPYHGSNPVLRFGCHNPSNHARFVRFPFTPRSAMNLTPYANAADMATQCNDSGFFFGKVTHPTGAPDGKVILTWSAGGSHRYDLDGGVYLADQAQPTDDPRTYIRVVDTPEYHEIQGRAVVSYARIYGIPEPASHPEWPIQDTRLLPGEANGLIGSSSICKHEADTLNPRFENFVVQGASIGQGLYDCDDIHAIRLVGLEPTSHFPAGQGRLVAKSLWYDQAITHLERHRILGELPLKKYDSAGNLVLDAEGNPDTSFLAKIPANTPFTFQVINAQGELLIHSPTWHQLSAGEKRTDCGGCHAHSQIPLAFLGTEASKSTYPVVDFSEVTRLLQPDGTFMDIAEPVVDVEFDQDIAPILTRLGISMTWEQATADIQGYDSWQSPFVELLATFGATPQELFTARRWIDMGAPLDKGGWFIDDLRPALHIHEEDGSLWVGAADQKSRVDTTSLVVTVGGVDVTAQLGVAGTNRWSLPLFTGGHVRASIADVQGNITTFSRSFVPDGETPMVYDVDVVHGDQVRVQVRSDGPGARVTIRAPDEVSVEVE